MNYQLSLRNLLLKAGPVILLLGSVVGVGSPRPASALSDSPPVAENSAADPFQVYLPLISRPPAPSHYGHVFLNGVPIGGVELELRGFFNESGIVTFATTTTDVAGFYTFYDVPNLASAVYYFVHYNNTFHTEGRLSEWHTHSLSHYTAGSSIAIRDFDIADIQLVFPPSPATISLPNTFKWTPRPATPSDRYEFHLFDPSDLKPLFYTNPPLNYVGEFTLNTLPLLFTTGTEYAWSVWVFAPDLGFGISNYSRLVTFSN